MSSAFLATQHLATPSNTCTCPRRFPISVMMLMAESYLGKAVCAAGLGGWIRQAQPGPHRRPLHPGDLTCRSPRLRWMSAKQSRQRACSGRSPC